MLFKLHLLVKKILYCKSFKQFLDDINASNNGLPLTRYDAFLLYDKADIQSAAAIVDKLEIDYKLKVIILYYLKAYFFILIITLVCSVVLYLPKYTIG